MLRDGERFLDPQPKFFGLKYIIHFTIIYWSVVLYLLIGNNDTNIMSEQLSKDTAKMHRLELENQRLNLEVDDLKMNGIKEQTKKCLQLERENKCQALTIKQLQVCC